MGINVNSPAKEDLAIAEKAYKEGNYEKALQYLTYGFEKDNSNKLLYQLAMNCLDELGGEEEAELFNDVLENFKDADEFYSLGYYYVGVGNYRLAIPFLQRANKLAPQDNNIALELSVALTAHFRPWEAQEVLGKLEDISEFWVGYQYLWCSLLLDKRKGITEFISFSRKKINETEFECDCEAEEYMDALNELQECYDRLCLIDSIKCKPKNSIQKWQFIQYGGIILDYFDDTSIAGGRYVALWGQYSTVSTVLKKLVKILNGLNRRVEKIISLEDRNSIVLSMALSKIMNIECELIDKENIEEPNSLIVASSANELCQYEDYDFQKINENQTIFAFNLNWLSDCCIAPDIVGVMTQSYFFPWENSGLSFNFETEEVEMVPIVEKENDEIVESILSETIEIGEEFKDILDFYLEVEDYLRGGKKSGDMRLEFYTDSPVSGVYFS